MYKIIQNNEVVDVGMYFVQWNQGNAAYFYCDREGAQLLQGQISGMFYHDFWLLFPPDGSDAYEEAQIIAIDASEYDELLAMLEEGEEVPAPEPEQEPEPEPEPASDPERSMTIQEMRERIAELTALVMNESKPFTATKSYMKGEMIADGSRIYRATRAIVRGETVTPGENCEETSIAELLTALQAQKEE